MNNYRKNVIKYLNNNDFKNKEWEKFESQLKSSLHLDYNLGALQWIKDIAEYHINEKTGSKYWIDKARREGITSRKIYEADSIDSLLGILGESDTNLLKIENGYSNFYKPNNISIVDLHKSSSSGTTGPAKTVYHSADALALSAVDEYTGIKAQFPVKELAGKKLLTPGPKGAYQVEHSILADLLDMEYIGNSFETKGLKMLSREDMANVMRPVIQKTVKYLQKGGIGMMTGATEMLGMLPKDIIERIDLMKLSGTMITADNIRKSEKTFGNTIIPMYGHYAGKSSIGFLEKSTDKIVYFSTYPLTVTYIKDETGKLAEYGNRGKMEMIIAQPEMLIIKEEDFVGRNKGNRYFKRIDGLSNPARDQ